MIDKYTKEIVALGRRKRARARVRIKPGTGKFIVNGKPLEGDQILMWYLSANRDEDVFDDADVIDIERHNADRHLSFGYGIHFCMGSRLAEMQLRVLWEEILRRFERIEIQDEPERTLSSFVHGYTSLPVTVTRR